MIEKEDGDVVVGGRGRTVGNKISLPDIYTATGGVGGGHFNAAVATYSGFECEEVLEKILDYIKANIITTH